MKAILQIYGIFRKEFFLQSRYRLVTINRLLIGPIISCVSAGVIYSGFFSVDRNLQLGDMNANNYLERLTFGFLVHNYLNSGYYFLGNKFFNEWSSGTLAVLWTAPCSRWTLLGGLTSLEYLRCLIITSVAIGVLMFLEPRPFVILLPELVVFSIIFALGAALGFLRVSLHLSNEGRAEVLDNFYLAFIFTGCLYIPKEILPRVVQPICELNPAYSGSRLMMSLWSGQGDKLAHFLMVIGALALVSIAISLIWKLFQNTILERSF